MQFYFWIIMHAMKMLRLVSWDILSRCKKLLEFEAEDGRPMVPRISGLLSFERPGNINGENIRGFTRYSKNGRRIYSSKNDLVQFQRREGRRGKGIAETAFHIATTILRGVSYGSSSRRCESERSEVFSMIIFTGSCWILFTDLFCWIRIL